MAYTLPPVWAGPFDPALKGNGANLRLVVKDASGNVVSGPLIQSFTEDASHPYQAAYRIVIAGIPTSYVPGVAEVDFSNILDPALQRVVTVALAGALSIAAPQPQPAPAVAVAASVLASNNLLVYYGPLSTLGGYNTIDAAARVVAAFDYVVFQLPASGDLANTYRIMDQARKINPSVRFYGYTALGSAASYAAWLTQMQLWDNSGSWAGVIDGVFIDQFGQDYATSTRANQNLAIAAVHSQGGHNWACFINAFGLETVFGTNPGETACTLGQAVGPVITDLVLLESYWQSNVAATLEAPEKRIYRSEMAQWMIGNAPARSLLPAAVIGTGGAGLLDYGVWDSARSELIGHGVSVMGVGNADYGATSHAYFATNEPNTL